MSNGTSPLEKMLSDNQLWLEAHGKNFPGNILKPHGRAHTCLLFLKFSEEDGMKQKTKNHLASLAAENILTSAHRQNKDALAFKAIGRETLFAGIYLTETGLRYFGWHEKDGKLEDLSFANNFPAGDFIENAYENQVDAMLCLAFGRLPHDRTELERHVRIFSKKFRHQLGATLVAAEWGGVLRNNKGQSVEAFGYPDGLSQPLFFASNSHPDAYQNWNPFFPTGVAVVEEPFKTEDGASTYGSYLAYLKLEQNVKAFKDLETKIQAQITKNGAVLNARVGESGMGRDLRGNPLATHQKTGNGAPSNDFNFHDDPVGIRCPFHAHVRKMNPRQAASPAPVIVRRGVPYGIQPGVYGGDDLVKKLPESGVGLLFLSFQSNLDAVVQLWQNGQNGTGGADPVLGGADVQLTENQRVALFDHRYPVAQNGQVGLAQAAGFGDMVKLRAALQFYAPSLAFLAQSRLA